MSLHPMVSSLRCRILAHKEALDKEAVILRFHIAELDKIIKREEARITDKEAE